MDSGRTTSEPGWTVLPEVAQDFLAGDTNRKKYLESVVTLELLAKNTDAPRAGVRVIIPVAAQRSVDGSEGSLSHSWWTYDFDTYYSAFPDDRRTLFDKLNGKNAPRAGGSFLKQAAPPEDSATSKKTATNKSCCGGGAGACGGRGGSCGPEVEEEEFPPGEIRPLPGTGTHRLDGTDANRSEVPDSDLQEQNENEKERLLREKFGQEDDWTRAADVIEELVREKCEAPCFLVGYSQGGVLAANVALRKYGPRRPQNVSALFVYFAMVNSKTVRELAKDHEQFFVKNIKPGGQTASTSSKLDVVIYAAEEPLGGEKFADLRKKGIKLTLPGSGNQEYLNGRPLSTKEPNSICQRDIDSTAFRFFEGNYVKRESERLFAEKEKLLGKQNVRLQAIVDMPGMARLSQHLCKMGSAALLASGVGAFYVDEAQRTIEVGPAGDQAAEGFLMPNQPSAYVDVQDAVGLFWQRCSRPPDLSVLARGYCFDFPPPFCPFEKIISDEEREGTRVRAETKAGRVGSVCNSRNNGTTCPVTARGSEIPALAGKPKRNKVAPGEFLIPRTVIQSHESWDTYIRDNAYLAGAVQELRSKCHESGWEYRFFDADARARFFEMDPVMRQLGLVIETEAPASRADDQEKSLYQQILRLTPPSCCGEVSAQNATTRNLLQTQQTGLRIWLSTELDERASKTKRKSMSALYKNNEKNYLRRTVPISELYHSLTDGAAKADLFRYSYVYAYGGVYLDTKSGFEAGFSVDDAIFGKPEQDGKRPRALMKILLGNWGLRYCDEVLQKPAGLEKHCEEYAQWIVAAQPRHRYLFRVLEQVARNIFFLKRSKQLAGQSSFLVDTGVPFHHEYRGMKVLATTGPVAFTNAITKEQNRQLHLLRLDTEGEDGAARLAADAGFPNPVPNDLKELGIRFVNVRDSSGGLVEDWGAVNKQLPTWG
eukprot:g19001.t1